MIDAMPEALEHQRSIQGPDPLSSAAFGTCAGLVGAVTAHVATTTLGRMGSDSWLQGLSGPPFFNIALYTAIFYGAIAWAAGRRATVAAVGFFVPFLSILIPMFILSRNGAWQEASPAAASPWIAAVIRIYTISLWSTICAIGACALPPRRVNSAFGAAVGSLVGYAAMMTVQKFMPSLLKIPHDPRSFLPPPIGLLDGIFSGGGLCLGVTLAARFIPRKRPRP